VHPSESPIRGASVRLDKHARQFYQNIVERLCLPRGICQLRVDYVCLVDSEILSKARISNKGQSESVIANLVADAMVSNHLPASHDDKEVQFYKDILEETKSVELSYTKRSKEGDTEIAFSKMVIFEALTLAKWGGDSHSVRVLKSGLVYSYIDYIDAWELALLFENSLNKQSWFLLLRLRDTTNNPNWFLDWGFSLAAAPIFVSEAFRKYKAAHLRTNDWDNNILTLLQFVIECSLPWTVRRDYIIEEGVSSQPIDDCFRLRDNHLSRRI
jgi:hypothetical protein